MIKDGSEPTLPRHHQDIQSPEIATRQNHDSSANSVRRHSFSSFAQGGTRDQSTGSSTQDATLLEEDHTSKEIYWCVDKPWTELRETILSVLQNSQHIRNDADFYIKLKAEYIRVRGHLKHKLFSWKTCTSVEFIKVNLSKYLIYAAVAYLLVLPCA
jgi:hypothetical protein